MTLRTRIISSPKVKIGVTIPSRGNRWQEELGVSKDEKTNMLGDREMGGGQRNRRGPVAWGLEARVHSVDLMPGVMEATERIYVGNDTIRFPFLRDHWLLCGKLQGKTAEPHGFSAGCLCVNSRWPESAHGILASP